MNWGFWTLDPQRDGARLELVAEIAASNPPRFSPARLELAALLAGVIPARERSTHNVRRLRAAER